MRDSRRGGQRSRNDREGSPRRSAPPIDHLSTLLTSVLYRSSIPGPSVIPSSALNRITVSSLPIDESSDVYTNFTQERRSQDNGNALPSMLEMCEEATRCGCRHYMSVQVDLKHGLRRTVKKLHQAGAREVQVDDIVEGPDAGSVRAVIESR